MRGTAALTTRKRSKTVAICTWHVARLRHGLNWLTYPDRHETSKHVIEEGMDAGGRIAAVLLKVYPSPLLCNFLTLQEKDNR